VGSTGGLSYNIYYNACVNGLAVYWNNGTLIASAYSSSCPNDLVSKSLKLGVPSILYYNKMSFAGSSAPSVGQTGGVINNDGNPTFTKNDIRGQTRSFAGGITP